MVVENYPGGDPVVILGSDGTDLHALLADALHRLVVAVGASVMDPLAATSANQVLIDARLDAIQVTRGAVAQAHRQGVLATGAGWTTLVSIAAKGVLLGIDLSTNYKLTDMVVAVDGNNIELLRRDGAFYLYVIPQHLNEAGGETSFWKEGIYDDVNDYYALHLKREVHYNTSLSVQVRQQSGVDKNVACSVLYQPEA